MRGKQKNSNEAKVLERSVGMAWMGGGFGETTLKCDLCGRVVTIHHVIGGSVETDLCPECRRMQAMMNALGSNSNSSSSRSSDSSIPPSSPS